MASKLFSYVQVQWSRLEMSENLFHISLLNGFLSQERNQTYIL